MFAQTSRRPTIAARDGRRRKQLIREDEHWRGLLRVLPYASGAVDGGEQPDADGLVDPQTQVYQCYVFQFSPMAARYSQTPTPQTSHLSSQGQAN